ncbi:hypothetical protein [Sphingobium cloacae]|uniref:Uncharacterized protein n=1 Tax=Sphingobium cloacae TaxID=120107 RepID=A0A1E1F3T1_9SPHN|nr:hypothetical protein [Sphingobium cloacae]BAV65101.1 hypothetical protein SCLO_1020610 [Sphingobium cloacae]
MTKKSYTPRWLDLRDEVAKSIGLLNAPIPDRQTINVLNNVTRTLMNGQALPDGLKKTFLENIRRRTRHTDFAYDGEIRMAAKQIRYARRHGKDQLIALPTAQPLSSALRPEDEKDELLDALQRHFVLIASHIRPDFVQLSSFLGSKSAQLLEFWWRNEIKSNEINHESAMICPQDDMRLAGSPDAHDIANDRHGPAALSGHAMIAHEPAAAGFSPARTIRENHETDEGMAREMPAPVVALPRRTRRPEIAISYFHNDPAKAPSAMFEYGDRKFSLNFATADSAEAKLAGVSDAEWMTWLDAAGGSELRQTSRDGIKTGRLHQYNMSPLYGPDDKYGYKGPVVGNCMVALIWEDECPVAAILVDNQNIHTIKLERFSQGEGRKPLFKGRTALPMQNDDPAAMAA